MTSQTRCLLRPWCKPLVPWSGHLCGLFSTSAQERQLASSNIWLTRESTFQSQLLNRRNGSEHSAALRRLLTIRDGFGGLLRDRLIALRFDEDVVRDAMEGLEKDVFELCLDVQSAVAHELRRDLQAVGVHVAASILDSGNG